jgi:hypothetical protein
VSREHANENAREGDGVADLRELLNLLRQPEASDEPPSEHDLGYEQASREIADKLEAILAAMQVQQGAEPVAWYCQSTCGGPIFVNADRTCVQGFMDQINAKQEAQGVSLPFRQQGPFPLAPATGAPR